MNAAVDVRNVSKSFSGKTGTVEAVKDVSFSIAPGEVVAVLGENGAGKSTLIDMVLGLSCPTHGEVQLFGSTPKRAVRDSRVSAVLQTGGLLKDLSVKDQIAMVAATFPSRPSIDAILEVAGITDIASRKIGKCSGGQQQKVKFALALLGNPDILILDEPTAGMDINARTVFWASMRAQATEGKTLVFATHYLEEAQDFADRIVLLSQGQLVADGSVDALRSQAGFRHVSFVLDGDVQLQLSELDKTSWGISEFRKRGDYYSLRCARVEGFLADLLPRYPVKNLEVLQPSLADAFVNLATASRS